MFQNIYVLHNNYILYDLYDNIALYWRKKWQPTPALLPEKSHG